MDWLGTKHSPMRSATGLVGWKAVGEVAYCETGPAVGREVGWSVLECGYRLGRRGKGKRLSPLACF